MLLVPFSVIEMNADRALFYGARDHRVNGAFENELLR